ncbi:MULTISPECIES: site-specific integrase [unclassified Enterococcus]|uniref:tyrosine-type recombinase/integrase n=1 Tax=unclassified Enterococcus TaxID=2608891 RepID=UPI0015526CE3|nr:MULTISPECIES: site-specific integrase [unclassified Enterococcus]MBS7577487.1 site-specific integrase [Enterococcus sp. MMGLQ5-2]MBS7585014.1 site-specific integrase [Enterococcus sp. MMGLQ5-1]NPD12870.1 site-specific integrase [Enterococcus sp. MMGLQ5-1]NPD37319.1 site-specific integrase [Enterococcus sp. MMGLQ5-2]
MWMEELPNGKYKYFERFIDPYTEKKKRVSVTLNSKSNQAVIQANKILQNKIDVKIEHKEKKKVTLKELHNEWWKQYEKSVKKSSAIATKKVSNKILSSIETDALISNIDVKFIQSYINSLDYSIEYIKKFKSYFNMIFKYAEQMEYINNNPVSNVKIVQRDGTDTNLDEKYLTREEIGKLLSVYKGSFQSIRMGLLIEFMYLTGLRVGEATALTVQDYNKNKKSIAIKGTLDYSSGYKHAIKTTAKTEKSNRNIFLSNRCVEILDDIISNNQLKFNGYCSESFIFIGKTGKPLQANAINTSMKYMNEKLGKEKINKPLHSHVLRHSHISLLSELNIPIKAIMERVGHVDEKTTLRIYTHVTEKQNSEISNKLNDVKL